MKTRKKLIAFLEKELAKDEKNRANWQKKPRTEDTLRRIVGLGGKICVLKYTLNWIAAHPEPSEA